MYALPKTMDPFSGFPFIRIIVKWGLYTLGFPYLQKVPMQGKEFRFGRLGLIVYVVRVQGFRDDGLGF